MTPVLVVVYRSIDWPLFLVIQVATDKRPKTRTITRSSTQELI